MRFIIKGLVDRYTDRYTVCIDEQIDTNYLQDGLIDSEPHSKIR